ncbi:hypothetical protein AAFP35_04495 [Gordonia sp. CPCC 206044]|uniref:TY-Chap domain-containing protein n=1 Tax=Gordonia sp. CPCC 206044 TaxID=3140793 RepID=UPI003AF40786
MDDAWIPVRAGLEDELARLGAGDALVVSEPDPPGDSSARKGGLLGRLRSRPATSVRYVQFRRLDDVRIAAECVGHAYREITAEQDARLIQLGWSPPQGLYEYQSDNFVRLFPAADAARAAQVGVEALGVLGGDAATAWTWERISD